LTRASPSKGTVDVQVAVYLDHHVNVNQD